MGKRTKTDSAVKNPQNFWKTPEPEISKLARHLEPGTIFVEPCAGDGQIVRVLEGLGHTCIDALDLHPQHPTVRAASALHQPPGPLVITNPPYAWHMLEPLLHQWVGYSEAWLLLPWDMPCNARFTPYAAHIDRMLPLGRVSWLCNGKGGMENSGWFHFSTAPAGLILPRRGSGSTHRTPLP